MCGGCPDLAVFGHVGDCPLAGPPPAAHSRSGCGCDVCAAQRARQLDDLRTAMNDPAWAAAAAT